MPTRLLPFAFGLLLLLIVPLACASGPSDEEVEQRRSSMEPDAQSTTQLLDECSDLKQAVTERFGDIDLIDIDDAASNQEKLDILDQAAEVIEFVNANRAQYCG